MSGSEFSKGKAYDDEDEDEDEDYEENSPDTALDFKTEIDAITAENKMAEDRIARFTGGPYTPFNESTLRTRS